jgi:hypothetical protein
MSWFGSGKDDKEDKPSNWAEEDPWAGKEGSNAGGSADPWAASAGGSVEDDHEHDRNPRLKNRREADDATAVVNDWVEENSRVVASDAGDASVADHTDQQQHSENDQSQPQTRGNQQKQQPVKISGPAYCGVVGLANLIQGGIAGGAIGFVHTMHDAYQQGIMRQPDFPAYLRQGVFRQSINFGGWLCVYGAAKCMSTHIRKKNDAMNDFVGGFFAGSVVSLQTRNPRTIIAAGLANGSVMLVMHSFMNRSTSTD